MLGIHSRVALRVQHYLWCACFTLVIECACVAQTSCCVDWHAGVNFASASGYCLCKDESGNTAFHYVSAWNSDLRNMFIEANSNMVATNGNGQTPAFYAINNDEWKLQCDMDVECDVQCSSHTLLQLACDELACGIGQTELAANQKMHLPTADSHGQIAMHVAAMAGFTTATWLTGDVTVKDHNGFNPLHTLMTSTDYQQDIFEVLVSKCDVNDVTVDGQTALHLAASKDSEVPMDAINKLVQAGIRSD